MKSNKLINSLKKYWWRILPYIFMIIIFFIPFLKLEINDLKLLYEKFEALISLMILRYLDICMTITIAVIINCGIEWLTKKIKTKRTMKNKIF